MDFSYVRVTDFPKHQKRLRLLPWIRVGIFNPKNPGEVIYVFGLVDSGADITMIDEEIGENLGFDIEKGKQEEILGVGGGKTQGYIHKVGYTIEDPSGKQKSVKYSDFAVFIKNPFSDSYPQQTAIWGIIGFFKHLIVTIHHPQMISVQTNLS